MRLISGRKTVFEVVSVRKKSQTRFRCYRHKIAVKTGEIDKIVISRLYKTVLHDTTARQKLLAFWEAAEGSLYCQWAQIAVF